ncbi:Alf1p [Sugiyamaella lignohabitans]|uniref:Alf1p n=1 Tax=Sugiyamaella lignohabitans TaxID=796027 RepID=A0A167DPY3_9ASCO|nr:Alf1p [Sugiyamaella lignohabitans]ANB13152.1 Alf1p [Sugiyamaella lignohabitans]
MATNDVSMFVTSEQTSSERRISPGWTVAQLKGKLEHITGIPPASQKIHIHGPSTKTTGLSVELSDQDENKILSSYNLAEYGRIHVEDTRPIGSQLNFNDTSAVEKYVMPEDEYSTREDSVLNWKKKNQLGRFDPNAKTVIEEQERQSEKLIQEKGIAVGLRCQVSSEGAHRRGQVKFVGEVPEIANKTTKVWIGVEFDEPLGKNDGSIAGVRYFEAKPLHGSFIKPELVEVGDFPEESLFDDDEL